MAFPLHNAVLINTWREMCVSFEAGKDIDENPERQRPSPARLFNESNIISEELAAVFPHLKSKREPMTPISTIGISLDNTTKPKQSEGLGISISEETEDELMSLNSSISQQQLDMPKITVEHAQSNSDDITDGDDDVAVHMMDTTPTIENTQSLDPKPEYERIDSARTINSGVTDDSDEIEHASIYNMHPANTHMRSNQVASPVSKPDSSSNKSPLLKQGNQLQTGLKTISRFILPKRGAGHHTERELDDISDHLDNDENEESFRSQRLMSKRKPPPLPPHPNVSSVSELHSHERQNDSKDTSSIGSVSESSSLVKIGSTPDDESIAIMKDFNSSDEDSDVESIESSELVDSDYSYNTNSPPKASDLPIDSYYDDNGGIVDDLDSDDYATEDDLYDSFYDDDRMDTPGLRPIGNTIPDSLIRGSESTGTVTIGGTNEVSQINFKRLRPQHVKVKTGSRRDSNTLASSQMMKIDLDELRSRKNSNLKDEPEEVMTSHFQFEKHQIGSTPQAPKVGTVSHLTELLNKTTINLSYYNYVGSSQKVCDELITVNVTIQDTSLELKVNSSCQIVDFIGFSLFNFFKSNPNGIEVKYQDPNYWKIFLVDSDGEIEDDFGPLDRKRLIKSYGGTDEFSIVKCSENEYQTNEDITPSPLKKESHTFTDDKNTANNSTNNILKLDNQQSLPTDDGGLVYNSIDGTQTLPSNLITPVANMKQNKYLQRQEMKKSESLGPNSPLEEEDSEEENESNDKVPEINKYLRKGLTNQQTVIGSGPSGLSKLKSSSKTIQSILHNTADHYQLTQEQLFNNFDSNTGNEDRSNLLSTYHRWTIWRRQQMTFKNKQPKTLTVDGYQIYILPFNDLDGSWYESKTYSFNISQILKIKQSIKVPTHFKIVVNKNTNDGMVKKYYLEAKTKSDCSDIVSTIRQLAKSMHQ